jgi:hypothetical protein
MHDDAWLAALSRETSVSLRQRADAAEQTIPNDHHRWVIDLQSLPVERRDSSLLNEVQIWDTKQTPCLYVIEGPESESEAQRAHAALLLFKQRNERAMPRLNPPSPCWYIGSSRNVTKRLAEHLGYGPKQTYALHLRHWGAALPFTLSIICVQYPDTATYTAVQDHEDYLWESRRPMFGRQGRT